jgi:histidinol phosphatase-like PHP family hydrolase
LENKLHTLCITDHFWDENVPGVKFGMEGGAFNGYATQTCAHIKLALPLPQHEGVRYLFGCETEMAVDHTIGVSRKTAEELDFIIVPTTHLHMRDLSIATEDRTNEKCAKAWVTRFDALLESGLPFHKVGIAHLTCPLFAPEKTLENTVECLSLIKSEDMYRLFAKTAECGMGVELNFSEELMYSVSTPEDEAILLHPYRIAKEMGCKFYLGGDAHDPECLASRRMWFERMVDLLDLTEDDKFDFVKAHIALV